MKPTLSLQPSDPPSLGNPTSHPEAPAGLIPGPGTDRSPNLLVLLTRPGVVAAVLAASVLLAGWSLLVRLPEASRTVPTAVPSQAGPARADASSRFSASDVARLRGQVSASLTRLVGNRDEFKNLLATLENDATQRGLKLQLAVAPPVPSVGGFTNLVAFPVTAEFTVADPDGSPSFETVLAWLDQLTRLPKRTEITDVVLQGDPRGLSGARTEFRILGVQDHAEPLSQ